MKTGISEDEGRLQRRAVFFLTLTTLLWGGSFLFTKLGVRDFPPVTFMTLRFAGAALLMAAFCTRRLPRLTLKVTARGALIGTALAAANIMFVTGISGTTISRAGFLNNLFVLIIPLLSFLLWQTRLEIATLFGVLLATAGLTQLAEGGLEGFNRGDLFSTICALFISVHILSVAKFMGDADVRLVTFIQFVAVALWGSLALLFTPAAILHPGPLALISLVYCIIFPTVIAFTLQNTWQRFISPTQAGLLYTLDPVWSLLGGLFFLREELSRREWLGCVLLFSAALLPLLFRLRREQRSPA
ncbi:MAG: EamA/RhaT family transporter [Deltaproteobacteria bacterium HGW-Deltaproteobacteria-4]|nr:MAG: EamA/RhaT family transporter [Deltaproteobacteria bacterium HGW-Deltaproteobacteria-4]